jgi:ubiquinone/menaquinone biosynthesis C-methylase UbiE
MTEYSLAVSDIEIKRYLLMAERARARESELWRSAGIVSGAVVADVGCGPAATSVVMAEVVGPTGRVIGVERDETALTAARQLVANAGVDNIELRQGTATATGLPPGSVDVAVMRHVLAHNGADEQRIVDHLAQLVRPGGSVYLADVDSSLMRSLGADPEIEDLSEKYAELQLRRGNDLKPGLRLGQLLQRAGLELVIHDGRFEILQPPSGMRPPSWAARDAMVSEGVASAADIERWEAAFARMDAATTRPTMFIPQFVAIGRR